MNRKILTRFALLAMVAGVLATHFPFLRARLALASTTCPTSGNNVTISTSCQFDAGTYTFTGTLTINSGITVTAASNNGSAPVILQSDSFTIAGTLSANGTGSGAGAGTGAGTGTRGGGYGGNGGSSGGTGGTTYGSATQPTNLGSGGAASAGGGAIKLIASGTTNITGAVSANGTDCANSNLGCGSGGSVWIQTGTLSGAGTITANGGNNSNPGGGGGGGRIALYATTDASTIAKKAIGGTDNTGGFNMLYNLSGGSGGLCGQTTYTAPDGTTVVSNQSTYGSVGATNYGLPYLFGGTWGTSAGEYWLSTTAGTATLTFTFPTSFPMSKVTVYPYARTDSFSKYYIQVSNDNSSWTTITPNDCSGYTHCAIGALGDNYTYTVGTTNKYIKFFLNNPSNYMPLNEVQVYYPVYPTQAGTGGAGSVYTNIGSQANGNLLVDNNNEDGGSTTQSTTQASQTYDRITIQNGAKYIIPGSDILALSSGGIFSSSATAATAFNVNSGGILTFPSSSTINIQNLTLTNSGTLNAGGAVDIASGSAILGGTVTNSFSSVTLENAGILEQKNLNTINIANALTIKSGGILRHTANTTSKLYVVDLSASSIDIQSGGAANVDGKGFAAGQGSGAGTGIKGGGYGGSGGDSGGSTYGSSTQPIDLGSGGGNSAGGGAIHLAASGTMNISGTVSANGTNCASSTGGCGSGGSVWLQANTLTGSGTVTVNGGNNSNPAGGGGGGRIAISAPTNTSSLTKQAAGGTDSTGTYQSVYGLFGGSGGTAGQTTYTAPDGTTAVSSVATYNSAPNYYMSNLFSGTWGTGTTEYWLSAGGPATLTFTFPNSFNMSKIGVYPYTRTDAWSRYLIQVSNNGSTWTNVTSNDCSGYTHCGQGAAGDYIEYAVNGIEKYAKFTLTAQGSWGVTLNEIQFYVPTYTTVAGTGGNGTINTGAPQVCGNSVVEGTESCDEGGLNGTPNHCNSSCTGTTASVCGNNVTEAGEACDDGNLVNETSCVYGTATCTACNATCTSVLNLAGAYCGDGIVQSGNGEACDDGNTANGDGCTSSCQTEASWTCVNGKCAKSSFPTSAGSTNLADVSNMDSISSFELATSQASVRWAGPVKASGQNFDQYVALGTGFVSVDKAHLDPSFNSSATVSMKVSTCANWKVYHSTVPVTSLSNLKSVGSLVGSGAGTSGSCTTYCANPACSANTLTYTVTGFDGTGGEGYQQVGVNTTLGISNQPPVFTTNPSDGGSSGTTPTNAGSNVTFTAIASDPNGDPYYVAVCKAPGITPHAGAAPTCDGGSWGSVSASTTSGNTIAPITYATSAGDAESNVWYAYACDGNGAGGSGDPDHQCSAYAQGTGDTGSPFKVNHRPAIGTVWAGSSYGSNSSVDPGGTLYMRAVATDPDTDTAPDTISMYVCSLATTAFDPATATCTGGAVLCSATGVASGDNADCSIPSLVAIPTAHGSYPFKVFLRDSHNFGDGGTGGSYSYSVTDMPPTVGTYSVNDISPTAGGSFATSFSVLVSDDNGWDDIDTVDGLIYDTASGSGGTTLSGGACVPNERNCYLRATCTKTQSSSTQVTATCDGIVTWFNIDPTSPGVWKAHANAIDSSHTVVGADSATDISVGSLSAVAVAETSIAYGGVPVGGTSLTSLPTTLANVGNIPIDIGIHGTDMSDGGGHSIVAPQQRWSTTSGFDYGTGDHALLTSETVPGSAGQGCANESLAVRPAHGYSSDTQLFWKLRIPALQPTGAYSGSNTFTSIVDGLCTGTD
jgi:cysteine-rich repeat protein